MKSLQSLTLAALAAFAGHADAQSSIVSGSAMGFASGVTGGGSASTVYVSAGDTATLKSYLESSSPQNIVISGTYDFTGTEGTTSYSACYPYSCKPSAGGQGMLNTLGGCSGQSTETVTIDTAGYQGINVKSDKTLVGTGTNTVIKGKGLRMVNVDNIIIQNVRISDINPQYVWGGDALVLSGTDLIWMDHITTASVGRQHYSFGQDSNTRITISNSYINGQTSYSATCDGHTYWALELVGSNDQITFYNNYLYYTSGRSPALSGTTLFHAANSVFESNTGHLIEGTDNGMGLYEGCVFKSVSTPVSSGAVVKLFTSDSSHVSECNAYLGRNCQTNSYTSSGSFSYADTSFFSRFSGYSVVSATAAASAATYVPSNAGNTLKT